MMNSVEKIINYLLSCDANNIKVVYIIKNKNIDTINKNNIKKKIIVEEGISISFSIDENNYFLAFSNIDNYKNIIRKINNIISSKKTKKIVDYFRLDNNAFNFEEEDIKRLNEKEYQKQLIEFLNKHNEKLNISIPLLYENKKTIIISPDNNVVYKSENYYKIDIIMNGVIKGINRFNYYSNGCLDDIRLIKSINLNDELNKLYDSIIKMQSINNINHKFDVVMTNGIGGILFHETCGHSLEIREINKKTSVFNDTTDVNNKMIKMIDNPKLDNKFGSYSIDDEGNSSKCIELIKNSKIKNYLCDNGGASCRRESYYNIFSSRMSNTYIANGDCSFDEIIRSVKDGFYVKNILGGVVDTLSGNFSFNCIESYRIINGKIDYSVCYDNLTIVGNAIEVLKNVTKIGNDLAFSSGVCGSVSGFVYTTVGEPTIKIEDLLVVS